VVVPPLRDRGEDVLILAEHFLRRFARKHGVKVTGFSDSARRAMVSYRWPGNVRELENAIERAVILSEDQRPITAVVLGLSPASDQGDLPLEYNSFAIGHSEVAEFTTDAGSEVMSPAVPVTAPRGGVITIAELEKQAIRAALIQTEGNRTHAANLLGISIRTLRNKLQEYRDSGDPVDSAASEE